MRVTDRKRGGGAELSRRIVITSGKGGVGKTSVAANLGMKLSKTHRVIVMDTDIGLYN